MIEVAHLFYSAGLGGCCGFSLMRAVFLSVFERTGGVCVVGAAGIVRQCFISKPPLWCLRPLCIAPLVLNPDAVSHTSQI